MSAFADTFGISKKEIAANWELVEWLKNGTRINAAEAVKTGILHWKEAGFPYIWGNLDDKWNLKDKAVLAAIGVFGAFVIYSLFQVSVRKRMSQYSVMQTLGMESKCTFGVLTSELWMIFAVAYPDLVCSRKCSSRGIYQKIGVFLYGQREFSIRICMSQQRRQRGCTGRTCTGGRISGFRRGDFLWSGLSAVPAYICKFDFSEADGNADTAGNDHKRRQITDKETADLQPETKRSHRYPDKEVYVFKKENFYRNHIVSVCGECSFFRNCLSDRKCKDQQ